jgi:hypothetical protein
VVPGLAAGSIEYCTSLENANSFIFDPAYAI